MRDAHASIDEETNSNRRRLSSVTRLESRKQAVSVGNNAATARTEPNTNWYARVFQNPATTSPDASAQRATFNTRVSRAVSFGGRGNIQIIMATPDVRCQTGGSGALANVSRFWGRRIVP